VQSSDHRYVLRRKPPGKLLPSAHAVDREYRVIVALADTPVPVAKAYALCEDPAVIGLRGLLNGQLSPAGRTCAIEV
jgi:aminoglycoside phosphotransferase (APT) family kinase protein